MGLPPSPVPCDKHVSSVSCSICSIQDMVVQTRESISSMTSRMLSKLPAPDRSDIRRPLNVEFNSPPGNPGPKFGRSLLLVLSESSPIVRDAFQRWRQGSRPPLRDCVGHARRFVLVLENKNKKVVLVSHQFRCPLSNTSQEK